MKQPFSLDGKRVLITGGGTGIGPGIAMAMQDAGASVVLTGRRIDVLEQAVAYLAGKAVYEQGEVSDLAS